MGGKVSVKSMKVSSQNSGDKNLIIYLSNKTNQSIPIYEQIDYIPYSVYRGKDEYEIEYCIHNLYNSLNQCAILFTNNEYAYNLDNYIITNEGSPCTSLTFRPGSIVKQMTYWLEGFVFKGNRCKIIYNGPPITENDLNECCTLKRVTGCHSTLIDNFKTDTCNVVMQDYCKRNPDNDACYTWLEQKTLQDKDIALKLYSNLCSNNFNEKYCDYMCMFARDQKVYSKYCDIALSNWCGKNVNDSNCWCYNTPSDNIPIYEKLLGPKECWLSSCTSNYQGQKWITTGQAQIKKNCKIQSCIVTIDKLKASGKALIDIINNCIKGGSSYVEAAKTYLPATDIKKMQTWGSQFNIYLFIIFIILLVFLIIYIIRYENIKYINKNI